MFVLTLRWSEFSKNKNIGDKAALSSKFSVKNSNFGKNTKCAEDKYQIFDQPWDNLGVKTAKKIGGWLVERILSYYQILVNFGQVDFPYSVFVFLLILILS